MSKKVLPDGFGATKPLKPKKIDKKDRKIIKTLSEEACLKLTGEEEGTKILTVANSVVANYYKVHRTPPV